MSCEVEEPNLNDPFEAHAYWALAFLCDGCPAGLALPEGVRQFSREWFETMAAHARKVEWTVDDPGGYGHYFDCYCPKCTATFRNMKEPNQSLQPNAGAAPSADEALLPRG
jgi:hypothetical protein